MSDTIPETVAAVLAHTCSIDCSDGCLMQDAAPALAREVQRLGKAHEATKQANRNLSDEVERSHAVYLDIADSLLPSSSGPADLLAEIRRLQSAADALNTARAECERLAEREPTAAEMERFLAGRDEIPVGDPHPTGWPTIRRCRHCTCPVAGGPTACVRCVAKEDARAECERLTAQLDAVTCDCGVNAITFAEVPQ